MKSLFRIAALSTAVACSPGVALPRVAPAAGDGAFATGDAPAAGDAVLAIAPPRLMPARYLRSLEYDPGGYSASTAFGASPLGGGDSDLLLGDLLFHSPRTLGARARRMGLSCNSCHPNGATHPELRLPGDASAPGSVDLTSSLFRQANDDGIDDPVNVPSLRGCRYTPPYGRDGRVASLSEFIAGVVETEFDGAPLSRVELSALTRYVLELDFLPNKNLDTHDALSPAASAAARRGERLFAAPRDGFGGESCASCHRPSTFFRDGAVHRLGTGSPPSPNAVDGGYETPTLLGLAETAPYFHDGRFATLADVVRWFDRRFSLGLSAVDASDLTSYLDAIGAVDRPRDDRPASLRTDQVFAYLSLVTARNSPSVRVAAVDGVLEVLRGEPPELRPRVEGLRQRIERLRDRTERAPAPATLNEAKLLREELARLAADWAGIVAARENVP